MITRKQSEHVKLYKALKLRGVSDVGPANAANPRRIVLVGRGDAELREVHALLDLMGHDTHVFTSGSAYLRWVADGKVSAEMTLLWFHTDDMQAPMVRKLATHRAGAFVLVVPEQLGGGLARDFSGFDATLALPTCIDDLSSLVETACADAEEKPATDNSPQAAAGYYS